MIIFEQRPVLITV